MNRQNFLIRVWRRLLKPIVLLIVGYYCVDFLISVFSENGSERLFTIAAFSLTILFLLVNLAGMLLSKMVDRIYSRLSEEAQLNLSSFTIIADYLALIGLGIVAYKLWLEDSLIVLAYVSFLIADKLLSIAKKDKSRDI